MVGLFFPKKMVFCKWQAPPPFFIAKWQFFCPPKKNHPLWDISSSPLPHQKIHCDEFKFFSWQKIFAGEFCEEKERHFVCLADYYFYIQDCDKNLLFGFLGFMSCRQIQVLATSRVILVPKCLISQKSFFIKFLNDGTMWGKIY